ncbi:hypothetical protein GGI25_004568 [Coemansia spiralis]|uniref:ZMIZ1 N-terminal domain-containing protein n=2 Tax=Coemansia TaxID=4863 RepID=A0A9W8G3Y8_9FUNG|nr:hypothetical protein EDC05_004362 [Coemansia umbellata]KAJ2620642.1 hypothetical protein GGI26_004804 [Coemansia sp. RSA 1358]KAJ2673821.1 hypothetical protein GGI25_004568 [Coemansia spiralis]
METSQTTTNTPALSSDFSSSSPSEEPHASSQPLIEFQLHSVGSASTQQSIDITVVSLARYTFADPARAANGPMLLEPSVDTRSPRHSEPTDNDIAEFTEERCDRELAHIARRLLLPDSYIAACYELLTFMDLQPVFTNEVQRNVFKCLKICARLSKLPGYNIHVMWQVVRQAHRRAAEFTEERAQTIGVWFAKLTNRIRLMTMTPAADGSAPPRLPERPPRELVDTRARERLLPLPELNIAALSDARFDKTTGSSSSSYYLANPISAQQAVEQGVVQPIERVPAVEVVRVDPVQSTREAELVVIEHQLRELERIPASQMGPMLRAALNLLVEMRFRLQLGLPRNPVASEPRAIEPPGVAPPTTNATDDFSREAFGEDANDETRVIDYVLNQISTSRRRRQEHRRLVTVDINGAPLYMLPHFANQHYPWPAAGSISHRSERRRRRGDQPDGSDNNSESSEEDENGEDSAGERRIVVTRRLTREPGGGAAANGTEEQMERRPVPLQRGEGEQQQVYHAMSRRRRRRIYQL